MVGRSTAMGLRVSWAVCLAVTLFFVPSAWSEQSQDTRSKIKVFVSILPQAYFLERIGGDRVDVSVMVGPGHSPATYEPLPVQMAELSQARLYFSIGVPFERVWMRRIEDANPDLKVIDTSRGIPLRSMAKHSHDAGETHRGEGWKDPHIWLSLRLVKVQAQNICNGLIREDPVHKGYYESHLRAFHQDLDALDAEIASMLSGVKGRPFMILHPALGYFARDYSLEQLPIEIEGKRPSARTLARVTEEAEEAGIRVILVQQQFSTKSAEAVARAIGGEVVRIDPLAKAYLRNMKKIAETLAEAMS